MSAPRRPRKPAPRPHFPKTLERDYAAALKRRLRIAARGVRSELEERGKMRVDSAADDASIRGAVGRVRMAYFERYTVVEDERIAIETAGKVEGYIERQVARQYKSVLGVDPLPSSKLQGAAREFANDNVALIRSLGSEFFEKLEADLVEAYADGARWEQLSKVVQERYGLEAKRANLIARDQMGTLASRVAMTKQQESGAIGYRWRNSQDERVVGNPSGLYPRGNSRHGDHWSREGKFFRWSDPPHDGHPGEAIQCRCTAEPVWDEEELEEGDEAPPEMLAGAPPSVASTRQAKSLLQKLKEESAEGRGWKGRLGELVNRDEPTSLDRAIPMLSVREVAEALDRPDAPPKAREAVRLMREGKVKVEYLDRETFLEAAGEPDIRAFTDGYKIYIPKETRGKLTAIAHELSHVVDIQLEAAYSLRDEEAAAWLFESDVRRLYGQEPIVTTRQEALEIYDQLYENE